MDKLPALSLGSLNGNMELSLFYRIVRRHEILSVKCLANFGRGQGNDVYYQDLNNV